MELRRRICGFVVLVIAMQDVDSQSTISRNRRPVMTVSLTLTCTDDGPITQQVSFLQDSLLRGACLSGCGTGIPGYAVSQNITARETYLTISSLEEPRDCGNWTCRQGSAAESSALQMGCSFPCYLDPSTDITITPNVSSLTSAENISVQVTASCCNKNAYMNWTYQKQNETPVTLASITTTPSGSCPTGQTETLNIFQPQRDDFPHSGKVNLILSIQHDSFDPPGYTVVFTKEIDLGAPEPDECGFPLIAVIILAILLVVKVVTDVLFVLYRWGGFFKGISVKKVYVLYWSCFVQGIVDCVVGVIFFIVTLAAYTECLDEPLAIVTLLLSIIVTIIGGVNILLCCCCYKPPGEVDGKPGSSEPSSNAGGPRPWLCCLKPQTKISSGEESRQSPPAPIPAAMASPRKPVPPNSTSARPLPSPTSDPASDSAVNPKVLLEPLNVEEPKKKKKRRKKRKSTKEAGEESTEQTMTAAGDSDDD